jgi:hypothetical protein
MDSEATSALLFECGICMDSKTIESINFLPCIHFICTNCHDKLIKNECPFCRNIISEEDSFDETENEYNDVHFEMLVMEEDRRSRRTKKFKKQEKRIMKLMQNNKEVFVTINHNTFRVLSNITDI